MVKPKLTSKERRRRKQLNAGEDRHHILFEKHFWSQENYAALRNDPLLIVVLDRRVHEILHLGDVVPPVPPLGNNVVQRVSKLYLKLKDSSTRNPNDGDCPGVDGIALLRMALDLVVENSQRSRNRSLSQLEIDLIDNIKDNLMVQSLFILWNDDVVTYARASYDDDILLPGDVKGWSGPAIIDELQQRYGDAGLL